MSGMLILSLSLPFSAPNLDDSQDGSHPWIVVPLKPALAGALRNKQRVILKAEKTGRVGLDDATVGLLHVDELRPGRRALVLGIEAAKVLANGGAFEGGCEWVGGWVGGRVGGMGGGGERERGESLECIDRPETPAQPPLPIYTRLTPLAAAVGVVDSPRRAVSQVHAVVERLASPVVAGVLVV